MCIPRTVCDRTGLHQSHITGHCTQQRALHQSHPNPYNQWTHITFVSLRSQDASHAGRQQPYPRAFRSLSAPCGRTCPSCWILVPLSLSTYISLMKPPMSISLSKWTITCHRLVGEGWEIIVLGDINIYAAPLNHCDGNFTSNIVTFRDHPTQAWFHNWLAQNGIMTNVMYSYWSGRYPMKKVCEAQVRIQMVKTLKRQNMDLKRTLWSQRLRLLSFEVMQGNSLYAMVQVNVEWFHHPGGIHFWVGGNLMVSLVYMVL